MARTNYQRNIELDHWFRNTQAALPAHLYVHLLESSPTTTTTFAQLDQPSAGAVQQLDGSVTNWARPSSTNGQAYNNVALVFTADAAWSITHYAITDGTNVRFYGALTASRNANVGDVLEFAVGTIVASET